MSNFSSNLTKGTIEVGGKRVALHCNHYNSFLQQVLIDSFGDDIKEIQIKTSKKLSLTALKGISASPTAANAENLFKEMALGLLESIDSDMVVVRNSHYAHGMYYKFGKQDQGVCLFAAGFILAAKEAITGKEYHNIKEIQCVAQDPETHAECKFEVS